MGLADLVMTDAQMDSLLGKGTAERWRVGVWHLATQEGRNARALGLSLGDCPPFVNDDVSISWKIGWYDEDHRRDPKGFEMRARHRAEAEDHEDSLAQKPVASVDRYSWTRRQKTCATCGALPGRPCMSKSGKRLADEHAARYK